MLISMTFLMTQALQLCQTDGNDPHRDLILKRQGHNSCQQHHRKLRSRFQRQTLRLLRLHAKLPASKKSLLERLCD